MQNPIFQDKFLEIAHRYANDFCAQLVLSTADLVQADQITIAQVSADGETAETVAWCQHGEIQPNLCYKVANTLIAETLKHEGYHCIPDRACEQHPDNLYFKKRKIQGYLGTAIHNAQGKLIGLLAVAFEQPIQDPENLIKLFELTKKRAAAELERQDYEHQLNQSIEDLRQRNEELKIAQNVYNHISDGIVVTNGRTQAIYVNQAMLDISGLKEEELLGKDPATLFGLHDYGATTADIAEHLIRAGHWQGEMTCRHKNGKTYYLSSAISTIPGESGKAAHYVGVHRDISTERKNTEVIAYQASHDQLTGLYNRYAFDDQMKRQLAAAKRLGRQAAFFLLDIDHFKMINDSQGHPVGDALLKQLASRLARSVREDDLLARLGGDEFAVLALVDNQTQAEVMGRHILTLFDQPFHTDNLALSMSTSIGISLCPDDATDERELFKCADQALYRAKAAGRNTLAFFTGELREKITRHQSVHQRLVRAIEQGTIETYFQPVVDCLTGEVNHCEALARWDDEELGQVSPEEFIRVAEETGLMRPLGQHIFLQATEQIHQLNASLGSRIAVAINRSPQEFFDSAGPTPEQATVMPQTALPSELICLEITENLVFDNPEIAKRTLTLLRDQGFSLALDDFGTGYSSLSYLKHLPFNILKIDRQFIDDIAELNADYQLVKTIIGIARNFGMKTIAEGVETEQQLQLLQSLGCDYAQGYYFSEALPMALFKRFVGAHNHRSLDGVS